MGEKIKTGGENNKLGISKRVLWGRYRTEEKGFEERIIHKGV